MSDTEESDGRNVSFKFYDAVPLPILGSGEISALAADGHNLFIGTSAGTLFKFSIRKHVHRDRTTTFDNKLRGQVTVGKSAVSQLFVLGGPVDNLVVLCGGVVTLRSLKDLSLVTTVPIKGEVSRVSVSDGSPFFGLCAVVKYRMYMYDVQQGFSICKELELPETPLSIQWLRKQLCLGFKREYSIVATDAAAPKRLCSLNVTPTIGALPTEELVLNTPQKVLFAFGNRRASRPALDMEFDSLEFAVSFPFLVSRSRDAVEIRNIMDPPYHEILRPPSKAPLRALISDGKEFYAADALKVYILLPSSAGYRLKDSQMFRTVKDHPEDKGLFVRYINHVLREAQNPFKMLLTEYADRFVQKFNNPEDSQLPMVKKYLIVALRKVYRVMISFFREFKEKGYRELLFSTIQTLYYAKIYWMIFAMMTWQHKQLDLSYFEKVMKFRQFTPEDLGVRKQFWLTPESLEDPPKTLKSKSTRSAVPNIFSSTDSPSSSSDSILPPKPKPNGDSIANRFMETERKRKFVDSIDESTDADFDTPSKKLIPSDPIPTSSRAPVTSTKIANTIGFDPLEQNPTVDFPQSSGQTKHTRKMSRPVNTESEDVSVDYTPMTDTELGMPPPSPAKGQLMGYGDAITSNMTQSVRQMFLGSPSVGPKLFQKKRFEFKAELHETNDPLAIVSHLIGRATVSNDIKDNIYVQIDGSESPIMVQRSRFSFNNEELAVSWQQKNRFYKLKFEDEYEFQQIYNYMDVVSDQSSSTSDAGHSSTDSALDELILNSLEVEQGSVNLTVSSPVLPRGSNLRPVAENTESDDAAKPKLSPMDKILFDMRDDDDEDAPNPLTQPYLKAIAVLRKLSYLKSPRDKLGCILQTFKETIQCVADFWEAQGREAIVGADDLVPIFSYVILKARVPKLHSEMNFIYEFATDSEMKGRYGYGFATFQIGVEIVSRLEGPMAAEPESKGKGSTPISTNADPKTQQKRPAPSLVAATPGHTDSLSAEIAEKQQKLLKDRKTDDDADLDDFIQL